MKAFQVAVIVTLLGRYTIEQAHLFKAGRPDPRRQEEPSPEYKKILILQNIFFILRLLKSGSQLDMTILLANIAAVKACSVI